jgi:two-component system chemotaxis response regulator CheY
MKKTILVVDDSEFVRNYHSYILERAEFGVIKAIDGSDGLEKLYSKGCDLVLTDINMGRMDGYEFIRRVRAEPLFRELPIIIISTEGDTADRMKGFDAGANLYIVKPCEPAVMIENVRLVLSAN